MEVVTHFVNDTVEFYKWSLTIAGESSLLFVQVPLFSLSEGINVYLLLVSPPISYKISQDFFSSPRQEGEELANDVFSHPHTGDQLPVPALPVGGAKIHAGPPALHTQENAHSLQLQHGGPQFLHRQRGRDPALKERVEHG